MWVIILLTPKKEQNRISLLSFIGTLRTTCSIRTDELINSPVSRTIFTLMHRLYLQTLNSVKVLVNGAKWESCSALSNKTKTNPSKEWPVHQRPETATPCRETPLATEGNSCPRVKHTAKFCCQCSTNQIKLPLETPDFHTSGVATRLWEKKNYSCHTAPTFLKEWIFLISC